VITAGTVFSPAPRKTERYSGEDFECIIGLTKDTSGSFVYNLDSSIDDKQKRILKEWFLEL